MSIELLSQGQLLKIINMKVGRFQYCLSLNLIQPKIKMAGRGKVSIYGKAETLRASIISLLDSTGFDTNFIKAFLKGWDNNLIMEKINVPDGNGVMIIFYKIGDQVYFQTISNHHKILTNIRQHIKQELGQELEVLNIFWPHEYLAEIEQKFLMVFQKKETRAEVDAGFLRKKK